jgi:hypothetical protein
LSHQEIFGVFLLILILIGVVAFLEDCFTAVPAQFHVVPRKVVWLIEVPWLLALFGPTASLIGMILMPLINCVVALGLMFTYRRYALSVEMPERVLVGGWIGAAQVTLIPLAAVILYAIRMYLGAPFSQESAILATVLIYVGYGIFLLLMHQLRKRVLYDQKETLRKERLAQQRPVLRRKTTPKASE